MALDEAPLAVPAKLLAECAKSVSFIGSVREMPSGNKDCNCRIFSESALAGRNLVKTRLNNKARPERNSCTSSYTTQRGPHSRRCFTHRSAAKAWKGEKANISVTQHNAEASLVPWPTWPVHSKSEAALGQWQ